MTYSVTLSGDAGDQITWQVSVTDSGAFMTGAPVFSWLPLISTVVFCAVSVTVAIRRFNRQEF